MTLLLLTFPHLHVHSAHLLEHALTPRYTVLLGVSPLLAYSPSLTLLNLLNIPPNTPRAATKIQNSTIQQIQNRNSD
jgi:hypothetical protein